MLKTIVSILLLTVIGFGFASVSPVLAGETAAEAESLVRKAVDYVKGNGVDKAVLAFNSKEGEFVRGELYVFMFRVSDQAGARVVTLAHPINPGLIGKDLYDLKDPNGTRFMEAMANKAMKEQGGWVDYKWTHPQTKKVAEKSSYVLAVGPDVFVGCGIYK
jgi:hypothetical protein